MADRRISFRLKMTRDFHAPCTLVFRQWTRAEDLAAWFAPNPFAVTECAVDPRPGGTWRVTYQDRDQRAIEESGAFLVVEAPDRLEFTLTQRFDDGTEGPETRVRVDFADLPGRTTRMTFWQTGFTSRSMRDGNRTGWRSCFDKLRRHLETLLSDGGIPET